MESNAYQVVYGILAPLLGQFATKNAIALACTKSGRTAERLVAGDLSDVGDKLLPMLRSLVGEKVASRVLGEIHLKLDGGPSP